MAGLLARIQPSLSLSLSLSFFLLPITRHLRLFSHDHLSLSLLYSLWTWDYFVFLSVSVSFWRPHTNAHSLSPPSLICRGRCTLQQPSNKQQLLSSVQICQEPLEEREKRKNFADTERAKIFVEKFCVEQIENFRSIWSVSVEKTSAWKDNQLHTILVSDSYFD